MVAACLALPWQIAEGLAALWSRKSGRWLCALAGAQTLWYAVASSVSSRPWFSLFGSNWRRIGPAEAVLGLCAFAVLAAQLTFRENPRPSPLCSALLSSPRSSHRFAGILQYFDASIPYRPCRRIMRRPSDSTIVRPPGTLGHADYFGWWLAIAFFCAIALIRIEISFWRWLALLACILSGVAIVLSGTRSAILAVAAGVIALTVFSGIKPGRKHLKAGLFCAGLLLAFYVSPAGARIRARVRWSSDEPTGGARPLLWRDSLRMAAARPWTGFGPETFSAEFPRYQSVELARLFPEFYHESPHNTGLDALTSEGIPGLLIALGWVVLGACAGWRSRSALRAPLTCALVASCVASMFGAATAGPIFATLLVIAMLVGLVSRRIRLRAPQSETSAGIRVYHSDLALCLGVFGGSGLAVADFNVRRSSEQALRFGRAL